jgi:Carboxypeptidase regulatory-like domain
MLICGAAFAQSTGNLSGSVTSDEGNALAGVSVTLTGPGVSETRRTNDSGQFRFLGVTPGDYQLGAKLSGYSDVTVPGPIKSGQNTIDIKMAPGLHLRNE